MKRLFYLTLLSLWSCTKQIGDNSSQVAVTSPMSGIPTRRNHTAIYRITDSKLGTTIAFIPAFRLGAWLKYKRYEFSTDWTHIVTDNKNWDLTYDYASNKPGEITDLTFKDDQGMPGERLGTLSRKSIVKTHKHDCTPIEGIPVMDEDIWEARLPLVDDELYFLPEIKNINPFDKGKVALAALMNLKVESVFSEGGNHKIILTTKASSLQNFYINSEENDNQLKLIGSPVFSKKTHKIVGFIDKYEKGEDFSMSIMSIMSGLLRLEHEMKFSVLPVAKQVVKTSVSEEWKKKHCSYEYVTKVINQHIEQGEKLRQCATPQPAATEPVLPQFGSFKWCDEKTVLAEIERVINEKAVASCKLISDTQPTAVDEIPSQELPKICPQEVDAAIKAYINAEKSCQQRL